MKIICEKNVLITAVNNVQRAVSGKSTMPALEGILLRAMGSSLFLAGYDLDIGITTTIEAQVFESGDIVINAKMFGDIVRRMPEETVRIEVDGQLNVKIISGLTDEITVMGLPAADFPDIPSVEDGIGFSIPQQLMKSMIHQTLFAVATLDAGRPVHTGTLFEAEENMLRLVSVDGSRLAMRSEAVKMPEAMKFVVPGKTLSEVLKMLQDVETPMFFAVGKRHIVMQIDGYAVISRLLDGEFLSYKKAIPETVSTKITVNTREMMAAVERVSVVINDRIKSPLIADFREGIINFSCITSMGGGKSTIYCRMEGEQEEMGFNSRFLLDALKYAETDEICLELGSAVSPMKMVPVSGDSFLFLVLPVRMKKV